MSGLPARGLSRRALLGIPLLAAAAAGGGFYLLLRRMEAGRYDPHAVDNPLVGHPIPEFAALPAQAPAETGFGSADLRAAGRPVLVNFFASWCVPCRIEHPSLMALAKSGVPIWGIAYKDRSADAAKLLDEDGNPYARLARDESGRVSIDWGLYGVPETFLIDRGGIVRGHWAGPLSEDTVRDEVSPLLRKYA
jgi:cytochrome c biogenesis protein CcmG/thiol:disulfide interchange protein DsbE